MSDEQTQVLEPPEVKEPTPPQSAFTQEELDEGTAQAKKLTKGNNRVNLACSALILSRQLYAAARQDLSRLLGRVNASPATEEVLVRAMAHTATQPFTDEDLATRLADIGLNFLRAFIEDNIECEREEDAAEVAKATEERQATDLDLSAVGLDRLARPRTMFIYGDPETVKGKMAALLAHLTEVNGQAGPKTVTIVLDGDAPGGPQSVNKEETTNKKVLTPPSLLDRKSVV